MPENPDFTALERHGYCCAPQVKGRIHIRMQVKANIKTDSRKRHGIHRRIEMPFLVALHCNKQILTRQTTTIERQIQCACMRQAEMSFEPVMPPLKAKSINNFAHFNRNMTWRFNQRFITCAFLGRT